MLQNDYPIQRFVLLNSYLKEILNSKNNNPEFLNLKGSE